MTKRFTIMAMGTLLFAGSAFAASAGVSSANQLSKEKMTQRADRSSRVAKKAPKKGPLKELAITPVITNPEGTYVLYNKSVVGMDYYDPFDAEYACYVVFGDNNEVYIQDPLTFYGYGSYIKGELEDGVINVPLPQTVYYDEDYGYGHDVCILQYDSRSDDYVLTDIDNVEYLYDAESGAIELNLPGEAEDYILGYVYTDDESWWGDGDFFQEYTVFEGTINEIPEGLEVVEYMYNDGVVGHPVYLAFDDDTLYIKGLSEKLTDGVLVANIENGVASIMPDQILGVYYGYYIYSKTGYIEDGYFYLYPSDTAYELNVDTENNVISSVDPEMVLCLNASLEEPYFLDLFGDFKFYIQDTLAGTPLPVYYLEWSEDYYDWYGLYLIDFYISNVSTEGNVLDTEYLYYSVLVDGDVMEFEADDEEYIYNGVEGVMTEIPYYFNNGFDISFGPDADNERMVGIYMEGVTTVGVQTIYKYDGNVTKSAIVTYNVETGEYTEEPGESGVASITASDVMNVTYYDLNGRRVANPDKGIYVVRMMLNDGSTVTRKVVRK